MYIEVAAALRIAGQHNVPTCAGGMHTSNPSGSQLTDTSAADSSSLAWLTQTSATNAVQRRWPTLTGSGLPAQMQSMVQDVFQAIERPQYSAATSHFDGQLKRPGAQSVPNALWPNQAMETAKKQPSQIHSMEPTQKQAIELDKSQHTATAGDEHMYPRQLSASPVLVFSASTFPPSTSRAKAASAPAFPSTANTVPIACHAMQGLGMGGTPLPHHNGIFNAASAGNIGSQALPLDGAPMPSGLGAMQPASTANTAANMSTAPQRIWRPRPVPQPALTHAQVPETILFSDVKAVYIFIHIFVYVGSIYLCWVQAMHVFRF